MHDVFLNVDEAANFLRTTKKYIYKLVYMRRIPYYKPQNGRLLFDKTELENLIKASRISTQQELREKADALLNGRGR